MVYLPAVKPSRVVLALCAFIVVGCSSGAPSDGTSCVDLSDDQIASWAESHKDSLPDGVSVDNVAEKVQHLCAGARSARTPQSLNRRLLETAVRLSGSTASPAAAEPTLGPPPWTAGQVESFIRPAYEALQGEHGVLGPFTCAASPLAGDQDDPRQFFCVVVYRDGTRGSRVYTFDDGGRVSDVKDGPTTEMTDTERCTSRPDLEPSLPSCDDVGLPQQTPPLPEVDNHLFGSDGSSHGAEGSLPTGDGEDGSARQCGEMDYRSTAGSGTVDLNFTTGQGDCKSARMAVKAMLEGRGDWGPNGNAGGQTSDPWRCFGGRGSDDYALLCSPTGEDGADPKSVELTVTNVR